MSSESATKWASLRVYTLADDVLRSWGDRLTTSAWREALLDAARARDASGFAPSHERPTPPVPTWAWGAKPSAMEVFDLRERYRAQTRAEFAQQERGGRG